MARQAINDPKHLFSVNEEELSDDKTIGMSDPTIQRIDTGGAARTVTVPSASDAKHMAYLIEATGTDDDDITVENPAEETVVTISDGQVHLIVSDGSDWKNIRLN